MVLFLPRDAASVPLSRQVLDSCLRTLGVAPDTRTDIALALTEACANVIQHAGPGDEYEVLATAHDDRCVIEVVNTGNPGMAAAVPVAPAEPAPLLDEQGRGLTIIDAITENLQLSGDGQRGTVVHFEKSLEWVPGAAGQHLSADG